MRNNCKKYTTKDEINYEKIKEYLKKLDKIKLKLKNFFNFEIPNYVIDDIIMEENYSHFCLLLNLAVINKRISKNNANILKNGIKNICDIKNPYMKISQEYFLCN